MDTNKDDWSIQMLAHNLVECLEALIDKQPSMLELAQARYILAVAKHLMRRVEE